jgi:hypothetical protein
MDQNNQNLVQMEKELGEMDGQTIIFNRITKVEKKLDGLEDQLLDFMEKQQELVDIESNSEI